MAESNKSHIKCDKHLRCHNKSGSLTRYGFACGYVEVKGSASLWMEHTCYHITGKDTAGSIVRGATWSLTEARTMLRNLASGRTPPTSRDGSWYKEGV